MDLNVNGLNIRLPPFLYLASAVTTCLFLSVCENNPKKGVTLSFVEGF